MNPPMPPIHATAEDLNGLLTAARDAQTQPRLQALYCLQTQQARTRRQVAQLLGVSRHTVGRWLAAYDTGGIAKLLTSAKAPGKVPLVAPAIQEARRQRLAHPAGCAR
jgi:transposase